jgi:hypothetical protein
MEPAIGGSRQTRQQWARKSCGRAQSDIDAIAEKSARVLHKDLHRRVFRKSWPAVVAYAATIPLAFFSMRLTWLCFLALPLLFVLPVTRRSLEMRRASSAGGGSAA